ncbi:MAG: hypothetical protein AB7F64_05150, partial [Gammaproteobacteria bacterium]
MSGGLYGLQAWDFRYGYRNFPKGLKDLWRSCIQALTVLTSGRLVSGSWDGTIRIWNVASGECLKVLEGHTESVKALSVLPSGELVSG